MNILINAYACAPNWGSEQGMGWHWITELSKHHNLYVITEGEWRKEIEEALATLPSKERIHFYYNPVSEKIRRMCWNQGDWRFYWYYRKWQKKTLVLAKKICAEQQIDLIHQLNMVGFREPGYLWQIKDKPYVIGPIGGMELMPIRLLTHASMATLCKAIVKNTINRWQRRYSPRVKGAIQQAQCVITATKGCYDIVNKYHHQSHVVFINETGVSTNLAANMVHNFDHKGLRLLWVGRFMETKQLRLALDTLACIKRKDITLDIVGTGSPKEVAFYQDYAKTIGIADWLTWHGKVPNEQVPAMMQKADLLFFTSIMEATSTVVLEAISCNLPILCFDTCGFGPIVKEDVGVCIDMHNYPQAVQDFAHAITLLEKDKGRLKQYADACHNLRHTLSWEYKAKKTTEIYQQAVSQWTDNQHE